MIREYDLEKLQALSGLLAAGLRAWPADSRMPREVGKAFKEAQAQMNDLPRTIAQLAEALDRFHILERALSRMKALAGAAVELPQGADPAGYQVLHLEFTELARLVALEAGKNIYDGPKLKLTNKAQARSALIIIGYMDPVLKALAQRLNEQKELIIEAFNETLRFLEIVADSYPEAPGAQRLPELLKQVKDGSGPLMPARPSSNPGAMFH